MFKGQLGALGNKLRDGVKELASEAVKEAREAVREGQAMARAAAKSRQQRPSGAGMEVGGWETGGFEVVDTEVDAWDQGENAADAQEEVAEMGELLAELRAAAKAPAAPDDTAGESSEEGEEEEEEEDEEEEEEEGEEGEADGGDSPRWKPSARPETAERHKLAESKSLQGLASQLESRLQALQSKLSTMENRGEELAAAKAETEDALRESRLAVEMANSESERLAAQLKDREKTLAAAQESAAKLQDALEAETARGAELAKRIVASEQSKSQDDVDTAAWWELKLSTLTMEMEAVRSAFQEAEAATTLAKDGKEEAEKARAAAEANERAAERRALAAEQRATVLEMHSTHAQGMSDQMRQDNERRQKSFAAAVEKHVERFKTVLEAERDAAEARLEETQATCEQLEGRVVALVGDLQRAEAAAEEQAAAAHAERLRVAEYEEVLNGMKFQVAAAARASETSAVELNKHRTEWEEVAQSLRAELDAANAAADAAVRKAQIVQEEAQRSRFEAAQLRDAARECEAAKVAASIAQEEAAAAVAEAAAAKARVKDLQVELDRARAAEAASSSSTPGGKALSKSSEVAPQKPQPQQQHQQRANFAAFDLESLRRMPLLSVERAAATQRKAGVGSEQRQITMPGRSQMLWAYVALLHVLLLFAMGQSSHAHQACELHLRGALP